MFRLFCHCAVLCLVSQLCLTPWTVACQAPLSMGILQARILEWVAMPSSRGSSQPRDRTTSPALAGGFFTTSTTWESPRSLLSVPYFRPSLGHQGISWLLCPIQAVTSVVFSPDGNIQPITYSRTTSEASLPILSTQGWGSGLIYP